MTIFNLVDHNENAAIPVYYLPMGIVAAKCIFPCLLPSHRFIPDIFEKENIDIGWVLRVLLLRNKRTFITLSLRHGTFYVTIT